MVLKGKTKETVDSENIVKSLREEEANLLATISQNDWYYTRKMRNGKEVPTEIDILCNEAAERISAIREELKKYN